MTYEKRLYRGPDDLRAMQGLIEETWSLACRTHIGDLAWGRFSHIGREADWPTALWYGAEGLAGWGWTYQPDELRLMTRSPNQDLAREILNWFEETALSSELSVEVLESETHLAEALRSAGYRQDNEAPFALHMNRSLQDLPPITLPEGYRLKSMASDVSLARRAEAHRAAWSLLPFYEKGRERNVDVTSLVNEAAYATLVTAWPYRRELDWVVEVPDGRLVACCIIWLDERNKVAELEPVGTHRDHRRKGLGAAVCLAAMETARDLGAETAIVYPRGDAAYPVPQQLYRGLGFKPYARTQVFKKTTL